MAVVPYTIPDFNERIEEIITTQFADQPVVHKYLRLWVEELKELGDVQQSLAQDRSIGEATGEVLNIIGRIVGQERTIVGADLYDFFGFRGHLQALGWGSNYVEGIGGRWWSLGAPMGGDVTLDDEQYRQVIKARIMRNNSRGTPEDMLRYIRFVFGVDGKFTWNEGAVARVGVGRKLTNFEKALIAAEFSFQRYPTYYSPKPLGVALELFEYDSLGTLGFIGTPNAKGMITLSNPAPDGGIFASVKYFDELPPQPPAYEVDFTKDPNFPAELNFTRAGTATYLDDNGVLQTAAANIPRIRNGRVILEESRTNILLQSNNFLTTWSMSTGLSIVSSANDWWTLTHNGSASSLALFQSGRPTTSLVSTASMDVMPGTLNGCNLAISINTTADIARASFNFDTGVATVVGTAGAITTAMCTAQMVKHGDYWRCSLEVDASTSGLTATSNRIYLYPGVSATAQQAGTIKVRRAQLEPGKSPSSYIPTTTATVVRAAESCKTSALSLPSDGFTFYLEAVKYVPGVQYSAAFSDNPTARGNYVDFRVSNTVAYLNSTEGQRSGNTPIPPNGEIIRGAFCVSNNMPLNRMAINSQLSAERVDNYPVVSLGARNILKLGTTTNTVIGLWEIRKYAVYTVPFSSDQLSYLTYSQ